jgi:hypothetical protein
LPVTNLGPGDAIQAQLNSGPDLRNVCGHA